MTSSNPFSDDLRSTSEFHTAAVQSFASITADRLDRMDTRLDRTENAPVRIIGETGDRRAPNSSDCFATVRMDADSDSPDEGTASLTTPGSEKDFTEKIVEPQQGVNATSGTADSWGRYNPICPEDPQGQGHGVRVTNATGVGAVWAPVWSHNMRDEEATEERSSTAESSASCAKSDPAQLHKRSELERFVTEEIADDRWFSLTIEEDSSSSGSTASTPSIIAGRYDFPVFDRVNSREESWESGKREKVNCPYFDGSDSVRGWIFECQQYFYSQKTAPESKTSMASMFLKGKALKWFESFMRCKEDWPSWRDFCAELSHRFEISSDDRPVAEWRNISQTGSVMDYIESFEQFAIHMFIGGLKKPVRHAVSNLDPRTIGQAYKAARVQESNAAANLEMAVQQIKPGFRQFPQTYPGHPQNSTYKTNLGHPQTQNNQRFTSPHNKEMSRKLSLKEIAEKKAKGLCYRCDEPYGYGHKCKFLYNIEIRFDDECPVLEDTECCENCGQEEFVFQKDPQVSIHALTGEEAYRLIKVLGRLKGRDIVILVDSGSTHNFINEALVKRLKLPTVATRSYQVSLADGKKIVGEQKCEGLSWEMQGHQYESDMLVMPLKEYDIVLGAQWLGPLGDILWNLQKRYLKYEYMGQSVVLTANEPLLRWTNEKNTDDLDNVGQEMDLIEKDFTEKIVEPQQVADVRAHISSSGEAAAAVKERIDPQGQGHGVGAVWAPVRSHNRSDEEEATEERSPTAESSASCGKSDPPQSQKNTQRKKRSELKRCATLIAEDVEPKDDDSGPGEEAAAAVEERIGIPAVCVNATSGTAGSWRRDDGVLPGVEKWRHGDPQGQGQGHGVRAIKAATDVPVRSHNSSDEEEATEEERSLTAESSASCAKSDPAQLHKRSELERFVTEEIAQHGSSVADETSRRSDRRVQGAAATTEVRSGGDSKHNRQGRMGYWNQYDLSEPTLQSKMNLKPTGHQKFDVVNEFIAEPPGSSAVQAPAASKIIMDDQGKQIAGSGRGGYNNKGKKIVETDNDSKDTESRGGRDAHELNLPRGIAQLLESVASLPRNDTNTVVAEYRPSWSMLPNHILEEIATSVDAFLGNIRFRSVCKSWRSLKLRTWPEIYSPIHLGDGRVHYRGSLCMFSMNEDRLLGILRQNDDGNLRVFHSLYPEVEIGNIKHPAVVDLARSSVHLLGSHDMVRLRGEGCSNHLKAECAGNLDFMRVGDEEDLELEKLTPRLMNGFILASSAVVLGPMLIVIDEFGAVYGIDRERESSRPTLCPIPVFEKHSTHLLRFRDRALLVELAFEREYDPLSSLTYRIYELTVSSDREIRWDFFHGDLGGGGTLVLGRLSFYLPPVSDVYGYGDLLVFRYTLLGRRGMQVFHLKERSRAVVYGVVKPPEWCSRIVGLLG